MNASVVRALTDYFDESPEHVEAWDQKVVTKLENDTTLFKAFLTGCERTKWTIYTHAKFGAGNAPDLRPTSH